ncbi:ABC transporter [Dissulfurispira thermophila]|uniref:ABC transporter n=1 Tax=Dissulfurispira thermophila TaxID=2715679 RepID=A0A7G1H468_9BACT|nr:AarF/ABC1/UbiB kinase family protein [Dissulfurispira thermophila]BCB96527.1 ABC transporter [Dissulfurispira thermophila]
MNITRLTRTYRSARRLQQIINVFLRYGFGQIIDQVHLGRYIPFKKRLKSFGIWPTLKGPSVPERLRMAFAELGPTFIKLAQILSSRPDLITTQFADEFKKLQDEVPPFSAVEAKRIIQEDIKLPVDRIFRYFDDVPIAAASIAQVHRAELIDGSQVVAKIQRPNIRDQIESDINILTTIARLLDKYVPESRFFNPIGIVEEFSKTVRKEMDFVEEARNCCRFRKNFEHNLDVYIPKIYAEFVTERVIVMEMVEGVRIDNITAIEEMGLDRKEIAKIGVDAYFKQILEDGFFHADPHPGNILVMPTGMIAFLDFGIVGRVSDELKETMADTFLALIHRDFDRLIDQYIELGIVPEHVDIDAFRKDFKADLRDLLEPLYGLTLQEINFAQYLDTITHLAIKHNLKIPSDLLLINKAMLILENIGLQLDPDFDFIAAAEPYATRIIRKRISPTRLYDRARKNILEIGDFAFLFPRQIKQLIKKVLKDDIQVKMFHVNLPEFIKDMDRSSNRIAFAMIVSAMIVSSAIMHATGVRPTIFGISILGLSAFVLAFLLGIWLIISIIRSGRL